MRRRVYFHGSLKKLVGSDPFEVEAEDVASAIEGVTRQLPALAPNPVTGRFRVGVVGCDKAEDLKRTDMEDIHIVPQMSGGKKGGFFQILIGAVLVAAAFIISPSLSLEVSVALFTSGAAMMLGGVLSFLLPVPQRDTAVGDPEASKYLGSPRNTARIGTRIPVLYGRDRAYGHFISIDIDAKDIAV